LKIPATAGLLRPVILLPEEARNWPSERLQMVLAHELGHIDRLDWMWQWVAQVACVIHVLNPLAWLAAKRLRVESELACDDLVLAKGFDPQAYAKELIDIARQSRFNLASTLGMAKASDVEERIQSLLSSNTSRSRVRRAHLVFSTAIACTFVFLLASVQPVAGSPLRQPPKNVITLASGYDVQLPSGLKVHLRAITDRRMNYGRVSGEEAWKPDGRPWQGDTSPHFVRVTDKSGTHTEFDFGWENTFIRPDATGGKLRALLFEFESSSPRRLSTTGYVAQADGRKSWDLYESNKRVDSALSARGLARNLEFGSPPADNYHLAVADGPWKLEAVVPNRLHPTSTSQGMLIASSNKIVVIAPGPANDRKRDKWYSLYWKKLMGFHLSMNERTEADIEDPTLRQELAAFSLAERDLRVTPLDKMGQPILIHETWINPCGTTIELTAIDSRRVASFRIESRPWNWIEFRNLHLDPITPRPQSQGAATGVSPNARADFGSGVYFEVRGIASTKVSGRAFHPNVWWRGDGALLKTPPDFADLGMNQVTRGNSPFFIPIAMVVSSRNPDQIGAPMIATIVRQEDEKAAFSDPYGWTLAAGGGVSTTVALASNGPMTHATGIVGYSQGPWTRLTRIACDVDSLTPPKGHHRFLSFKLGDRSTLTCKLDHQNLAIDFPKGYDPLRFGARVVAIGSDGKRYVIRSDAFGGGGGMGVHFDPDDPEDQDNLQAKRAKIKAFEIETCPYTFKYLRNLALKPNS
jgi:hypothetical protein